MCSPYADLCTVGAEISLIYHHAWYRFGISTRVVRRRPRRQPFFCYSKVQYRTVRTLKFNSTSLKVILPQNGGLWAFRPLQPANDLEPSGRDPPPRLVSEGGRVDAGRLKRAEELDGTRGGGALRRRLAWVTADLEAIVLGRVAEDRVARGERRAAQRR